MILKTSTKILWLGFSPITSFDCKPNSGVSRLYHLILHGALKLAINQHSCSLSRHSRHSRRCHSKHLVFYQNSKNIFSLSTNSTPQASVRLLRQVSSTTSKYARDASQPMGIFRPEFGRRNFKNPASPVACRPSFPVSRARLFSFAHGQFKSRGAPSETLAAPRACFAGYSDTAMFV